MKYFLIASNYAPDDVVILENIEHATKLNRYIQWTPNVYEKITLLNRIRAKRNAEITLPKIRENCAKLEAELNELENSGGIFNKAKIKKVELELQKVQDEIERKEAELAYVEPSKLKFEW